MQLGPSIDHAWNCDGINTKLGHRRDAFLVEMVNRESLRCPAAGIQAVDLARLRLPINGKEIAAHAVGSRFGDVEYRVGGDCGIDGRAAPLEDERTGL